MGLLFGLGLFAGAWGILMLLHSLLPAAENASGVAAIMLSVTSRLTPAAMARGIRKLPFGGRALDTAYSVYEYVAWKPNPLLQIVYATLVFGGYGVAIIEAYPRIPNLFMPFWHKYTGVMVLFLTVFCWVKVCTTNPGIITARNWKKFDNYAFDNIIYMPGEEYQFRDGSGRSSVPKLARSKFDRITNNIISRFDHFCPWVNNAVGELNYRWFLAFLLSTVWLLWYGTYACASVLVSIIVKEDLFNQYFVNRATGQTVKAGYYIVFQFIMFHEGNLAMLLLLCGVMAVVVSLFFLYHLYLTLTNVTTNETFKWSMYRNWYHGQSLRALRESNDSRPTPRCQWLHFIGLGCLLPQDYRYDAPETNSYDQGWRANLQQVLRPLSERPLTDRGRGRDIRGITLVNMVDGGAASDSSPSQGTQSSKGPAAMHKERRKKKTNKKKKKKKKIP